MIVYLVMYHNNGHGDDGPFWHDELHEGWTDRTDAESRVTVLNEKVREELERDRITMIAYYETIAAKTPKYYAAPVTHDNLAKLCREFDEGYYVIQELTLDTPDGEA